MSSGTDALLLAMMALGIGPGDEVITTTYSFFATAGCVARLGATPVFVDIDPVTYNIDPGAVAAAVTPRTQGHPPRAPLRAERRPRPAAGVAARAGVPVIEDAAQAIGAAYKGRLVGGFGRGGLLLVLPQQEPGRVRRRRAGHDERRRAGRAGSAACACTAPTASTSTRSSAATSASTRCRRRCSASRLPHLAAWTEARRRNAARYGQLFADAGLAGAGDAAGCASPDRYHIFNQYVIRVPDRDALKRPPGRAQVGCAIYYPVPFHVQACFAYLGYQAGAFPHAERAARETLALPIYGELTEDQQRYVVAVIAEALGRTA